MSYWQARGVKTEIRPIPTQRSKQLLDLAEADFSDAILSRLQESERIEFSLRGGLAFRAIQAKRSGLRFDKTCLAIHSEKSTSQIRLANHRFPQKAGDVLVDYMEYYILQHADEIISSARDEDCSISSRTVVPFETPFVSVVVPHFNLGEFLPSALASLAQQDYPAYEVIVIDDGSTEPSSLETFRTLRRLYPSFRFFEQSNRGIGATRNYGLKLARGEYYLPFDSDNIAHPQMISRFVTALQRQPETAALTCYFDAFARDEDVVAGRFLYSVRPTGGPFVLAASQNIYGDACALYRTEILRKIGGFGEERDTSFEDWELFVRMRGLGLQVDVVPSVLFWYRHRESGFSRVTNGFANQQRVLRAFAQATQLPAQEREWLTQVLAGMEQHRQMRQSRNLHQRIWAWLNGRD